MNPFERCLIQNAFICEFVDSYETDEGDRIVMAKGCQISKSVLDQANEMLRLRGDNKINSEILKITFDVWSHNFHLNWLASGLTMRGAL